MRRRPASVRRRSSIRTAFGALSAACLVAVSGNAVPRLDAQQAYDDDPGPARDVALVAGFHAGANSANPVVGANVALGVLVNRVEFRATLADHAALWSGCVDDCPVGPRSSGDVSVLYRVASGRHGSGTYLGAAFGWARVWGYDPAFGVVAGLDARVGRATLVRFEARGMQTLRGHLGSSWTGGPINWPPVRQVTAGVGIGARVSPRARAPLTRHPCGIVSTSDGSCHHVDMRGAQ